MLDYKVWFPCRRSLTITDLYPNKNFRRNVLDVGFYEGNLYRSYVYFDLSNLPDKFTVNSAILKLYIKNYIPYNKENVLYIYPLGEKFNKYTTFKNQPGYINEFAKFNIPDYYNRWLYINVTKIFNILKENGMKNKGILIKSDESKNSLISFYSSLADDFKNAPRLYIDYSCDSPSCNKKRCIDVKKKKWLLKNFNNKITTTPVNVERIVQGTFFINNLGNDTITAEVEVSFDSIKWVKDQSITVNPKKSEALIAQYYGRYYRIVLNSITKGNADVKFVYQVYV